LLPAHGLSRRRRRSSSKREILIFKNYSIFQKLKTSNYRIFKKKISSSSALQTCLEKIQSEVCDPSGVLSQEQQQKLNDALVQMQKQTEQANILILFVFLMNCTTILHCRKATPMTSSSAANAAKRA
jgi:hypothetical protein